MEQPQRTWRRDYAPPAFLVDRVDLTVALDDPETLVTAILELRRNPAAGGGDLMLDGEGLDLRAIALDGVPLASDRFRQADNRLVVSGLGDTGRLETTVAIRPGENTALSGLYRTGGLYCTQCEAEGFRRITFFPDRPDVMARYRVTITADRAACPVLLSNGNLVAEDDLGDGRQRAVWEDPHPKPSYLFALVAGDLRCRAGSFTTMEGRDVRCEIWVEPGNEDRCQHALDSLIKSMRWDEECFGRAYDLDRYMIVAVKDFNMGAMENKGLNVFNAKYVLASPETATDDDYEHVEAVIAHEYFHNWTGNRVTCRDWFQLTLKEGLTVFRDQQFTADQTDAAVKRMDDVSLLRTYQFPEDRGPMAHPIRPESYERMDNFYTVTVYEKGAEVIRLYHTLFGSDGFRRGMDLYFERHDGQAVTCDDFRAAMADANKADLDQFEEWYKQAGTPRLAVAMSHDPIAATCTVRFAQSRADLAGHQPYRPMHLPVALALLGADGQELELVEDSGRAHGREALVELRQAEETVTFTGISERPVLSALRRFSAPVVLDLEQSDEDLAFRLAHDGDPFNRFDAGQELAHRRLAAALATGGDGPVLGDGFVAAWGRVLADDSLSTSFRARALGLPSEALLGQRLAVEDVDAVQGVRERALGELAAAHGPALRATYEHQFVDGGTPCDQGPIGRRRLAQACLAVLARSGDGQAVALAAAQYRASQTMTSAQNALRILVDRGGAEAEACLVDFHQRWRHEPLVLDKWFSLQALAQAEGSLERVLALRNHPDFTLANPNRVRSLIGAFSHNRVHFHDRSGRGYDLVADAVWELDGRNPQVAARLVAAFNHWRRFDHERQALMRARLERVAAKSDLSRDTREIVGKALG